MNKFFYIKGSNFSGRSATLKKKSNHKDVYLIGEDPTNCFSTLMPTVEEEILFHLQNKDAAIIKTFSDLFGFENLMQTNPFNLSGGEQTILCVFIHLLLSPQKIIIDNTFEQLNKSWRDTLKQFIQTHYSEVEFHISDNRFSEYGWEAQIIKPSPTNDYKLVFDMPNFNLNLNYKKEAKKNVFVIKNLFFSYSNRKPIFENSNFRFESGIYHLKGNNGAGKSTLSKIILGIIKAKKAEFHFNSAPIKVYKYPGAICSYTSQIPTDQFFEKTVRQEIIGAGEFEDKKFNLITEILGLKSVLQVNPQTLSFTIQKRISLASTLYNDRPIMIFDEPTLSQDAQFVEGFASLINKMSDLGKIIIVISHSDYLMNLLKDVKKIELKRL